MATRGHPLIATLIAVLLSPNPQVATAAEPAKGNLDQLIELAKKNYPGVEAARRAVEVMEGKLYQARWAWIPQGTVKGLLAPAPDIKCKDAAGILDPDGVQCVQTTSVNVNSFKVAGIFTRVNLEAGMPLYTFDKLGSAKRAARAGLALRRAQVRATQEKVALDVAKAYWALKLAREILHTLKEGQSYLVEARERLDKQLDSGEGDATLTDLLRLKTASAEVEARIHEAEKLQTLSRAALATLTGSKTEADDLILEVMQGTPNDLDSYLKLARQHRPEVGMLKAGSLARQAAVDLERSKFYPDLLLVAMAGVGYASSVDDPQNAFYSDPFNFMSAGFGLALRWKFDQVQQYGRYRVARAEAGQTEALRREALAGIELEVQKTLIDLTEALQRKSTAKKGEKAARSWLIATSQNLQAGLAEPKDLTDSLVAFFTLRLKYLQAIFDVNVGWYDLARVIGTAARG